jgi:lipid-A-disaccharide synthase
MGPQPGGTTLGIIAGSGDLPGQLIDYARAANRRVFVLAIKGQTDPALVADVDHGWIDMGASETGFRLLRQAGVGDVVMAGGIRRPTLSELKPDRRVIRLFAKAGLTGLGDDRLLKLVRDEIEGEGFRLLGPQQIIEELIARPGEYGRHSPDERAEADIAFGVRVLSALGELDVGQAAIVQQGIVLGLEAVEGTDALLERCVELKRAGPGGVLIKAAKRMQENRFDLPTIGPTTVERAAVAGLRGIAIEAGRSFVLDRPRVVERADALGLFVTGFERPAEAGESEAKPKLIYLIAGEPSGDAIGAKLMRALRKLTDGAVQFAGIGGEQMAAEGFASLFPIKGLAIIGVFEVLPAAARILRWVKSTADDIDRLRPHAVVTIDSSGFCFRVADQLRRRGSPPPIIHYVAPMVWVWRPGRVKNAVRAADHLLTLLPFEPNYFIPKGLPATFVGHPAIEDLPPRDGAERFRTAHGIEADAALLCVLPGSRRSEVERLLPVFKDTVRMLSQTVKDLVTVLPTVETVAATVTRAAEAWPTRLIITRTVADKRDAFAAATAALAASGTVSLELAVAGVPMVVAYRIAPLTHFFLSRMAQVPFASLINILLDRAVIPEFLQTACTPSALHGALLPAKDRVF